MIKVLKSNCASKILVNNINVRALLGDCKWEEWSKWSNCSDLCEGVQSRSRAIATEAIGKGKGCKGSTADIRGCFESVCPGKLKLFYEIACLFHTFINLVAGVV